MKPGELDESVSALGVPYLYYEARADHLIINLRIDRHMRRRVSRPARCGAYVNHYWKVAAIYCRGKRKVNLIESGLIQRKYI